MKVLKGGLKGKNIIVPAKIRPVSVKVRKACFDILGEVLEGRCVLDLFAGSGSLGIEAISCGAKSGVFVDIKKRCVETIKKNLTIFRLIPQAQVHLKDAFRKIKDLSSAGCSFDIIFLDPPYYKGMMRKSLQTLEEYDILAPSGYLVCFCFNKDDFIKESKSFSLIVSKKYGQTLLLIYRKK